jgi:hypothetical protein
VVLPKCGLELIEGTLAERDLFFSFNSSDYGGKCTEILVLEQYGSGLFNNTLSSSCLTFDEIFGC